MAPCRRWWQLAEPEHWGPETEALAGSATGVAGGIPAPPATAPAAPPLTP